MTARSPKDNEEHIKALVAIMNGRGKSIAEVIEQLSGEVPTEEMVEAVTNRLKMAQENGESVDITEIVSSMNSMADQWA